MPDTITVALEFDFKGKHHVLKSQIDLAPHLRSGVLPDLHQLLAREHGFDLYSYEYEMMQAEEPQIVEAEGLARDYVQAGQLDWAGLCEAERMRDVDEVIQRIAREQLGVADIQQQPLVRTALLTAYRSGFDTARKETSAET